MEIVSLILTEHKRLRECAGDFQNETVDGSFRLHRAREFLSVLKEHLETEEEVLYKKIVSYPDFHSKILESLVEHSIANDQIDILLSTMKRAQVLTPGVSAKLKVLADIIGHHMEEEESEVLPYLGEFFSDEQLGRMGSDFIKARGWHELDLGIHQGSAEA